MDPPFNTPAECSHPRRDREMICSVCGVLLHDTARAIDPPNDSVVAAADELITAMEAVRYGESDHAADERVGLAVKVLTEAVRAWRPERDADPAELDGLDHAGALRVIRYLRRRFPCITHE